MLCGLSSHSSSHFAVGVRFVQCMTARFCCLHLWFPTITDAECLECLGSVCDVVDNYVLTGSPPAVCFVVVCTCVMPCVSCSPRWCVLLLRRATVLQTAVDCERAFLAALDGNCKTPIAGQVSLSSKLVEAQTRREHIEAPSIHPIAPSPIRILTRHFLGNLYTAVTPVNPCWTCRSSRQTRIDQVSLAFTEHVLSGCC